MATWKYLLVETFVPSNFTLWLLKLMASHFSFFTNHTLPPKACGVNFKCPQLHAKKDTSGVVVQF